MKVFLKSSIFILICSIFAFYTFAENNVHFYTTELRSFKLDAVDVKTYQEKILLDEEASSFIVITSSFLETLDNNLDFIKELNKYVLVCDSEYTNSLLSCNKNSISYAEDTNIEQVMIHSNDGKYLIRYADASVEAFYIPEDLFIIPKYSTHLKDYFYEYYRSGNIDGYILQTTIKEPFLVEYKDQIISLVYLLLFPLLLRTIILLNDLVTKPILSLLHFENETFKKRELYLLYKLGIILRWPFILAMFFVLVFLKNNAYKNSIDIFSLEQIKAYFANVLTYHSTFLYILIVCLLSIFWIPTFFSIIYKGYSTLAIIRVKTRSPIIVKTFLLLLVVQIFLFSSNLFKNAVIFYWILLFCNIYLLNLFNVHIQPRFSKKQKFQLFILVSIIVLVGNISRYFLNKEPSSHKNLFSYDSEIVILPKFKDFAKNTIYQPFLLEPKSTLFVNDYLVYFPGAKFIKNLDISQLELTRNYVVVLPEKKEDVISELLSTSTLLDLLKADVNTNYYYFSVGLENKVLYYDLYIDISCRDLPEGNIIKLVLYSKDTNDKTSRIPLEPIKFPGCASSEDVFKYTAPIAFENKNNFVLKIEGVDSDKLTNIQLFDNGIPVALIPINVTTINRVFIETELDRVVDTVYAYSTEEKELEVINTINTSVFNISDVLNYMINNDYIDKYFVLWDTRAKHSILLNPF